MPLVRRTVLASAAVLILASCNRNAEAKKDESFPDPLGTVPGQRSIYLAGGCFWGTEEYMRGVYGVTATEVGYANGTDGPRPTYREVCSGRRGFAETTHVFYDPKKVDLGFLLQVFYRSIDPTAKNRQGNDEGVQYRCGVYYAAPKDLAEIRKSVEALAKKCQKPLALEVAPLRNFFTAEAYHQKYLVKNPGGYCHVPKASIDEAKLLRPTGKGFRKAETDEDLKKRLSPVQYEVTQQCGTEPPFRNAYWNNHRKGIYVDIVSGEPLFSSTDKFDSGTGWPSFVKPLPGASIRNSDDHSYGMLRTEVKSASGSHLGHVFPDGPKDRGGMRYCMNSAALRFIPKEEMEKAGYGEWLKYVK